MLTAFFTGLFHKRCPVCKREVHKDGNVAVHRLGRWFCSEQHADLYELDLYEALRAVHCRHLGCHGEHALLPEAMRVALPHTPGRGVSPAREEPKRCPPQ